MSLGSKDFLMRNVFNIDPESVRRGIQVSANLRKNSPICRKGLHEMTPENIKTKTRSGKISRECISCAKIAYDLRRVGPRQEPLCP